MRLEIGVMRPDEITEAGRATADAYLEFAPQPNSPNPSEGWDYYGRIADMAARATRTTILVARDLDSGTVIGSLTLEMRLRTDEEREPLPEDEAHIRMFGIAPSARGQGAGRALMEECLARCRAAGKRLVTLHTTAQMQAAQRLYQSLGFSRGEDEQMANGGVLLNYSLRWEETGAGGRRQEGSAATAPHAVTPESCL